MNRILVVYFSRTGYTRRVAQLLATRLGADIASIEESRPRSGAGGYLRSAWQSLRNRDAPIAPPKGDVRAYDVLVLGTPVWAGHASSPARTFARRFGTHAERVALFCTMGGTGNGAALAELQKDLHHTPLATLTLTDSQIDSDVIDYPVTAFVNSLKARLPSAPQAQAA
jgi:hypothetical protein